MTSPRRRFAAQRRDPAAGSPEISEPVFVLVGTLRRPHGLRGEALISISTDFPEHLQKGAKLLMGEDHTPLTIHSRRETNEGLLLSFEEFSGRASLESFHNEPLFIRVADLPALSGGRYYQHQLLGLDVITDEGETLGKLVQIMDTSANDVYLVKATDGEEILLPSIHDVIQRIDLPNKRIVVHLIPGLLPEK